MERVWSKGDGVGTCQILDWEGKGNFGEVFIIYCLEREEEKNLGHNPKLPSTLY